MGRISDLIRGRFGVGSQVTERPVYEPSEIEKAYFERIKQPLNEKRYDYLELYTKFQEVYRTQNGHEYDGVDVPILHDIIRYFSKDIAFIAGGKRRSFDKGLLLKGGYGVGKTSIMRAIKTIYPDIFGLKSVIDIVQYFDVEGSPVVRRFAEKGDFCFDDLGTEKQGKNYGNSQNIMKDILELRYNKYRIGVKTHITTNLNHEQFKERYGERLESRLHEMFNVLVFTGEDQRKK